MGSGRGQTGSQQQTSTGTLLFIVLVRCRIPSVMTVVRLCRIWPVRAGSPSAYSGTAWSEEAGGVHDADQEDGHYSMVDAAHSGA
jgi:hypothetical protein